ncbi:hypothetical protein DEJ50_19345 [Streptomyces venezuelae]|uniref:Uncharacterized protein n=1 Tax=Streptomyces venezuelae TaxID=54571 RepID=A0A5P2D8N4_STRVZ|nr:hypothetical protein [Streptomyces venezuelae]QES49641.1 hypothetical protein DEJ50_19345 [Streptomyces venezuelae]
MSTPEPGEPPAQKPAAEEKDTAEPSEDREGGAKAEEQEPAPQAAWDTRQTLRRHLPRTLSFDGVNHGVVADQIVGDVYYQFGRSGPTQSSGEIPGEELDARALTFVTEGTSFETLRERLEKEQVLVLTGAPFTGRRTAALMLLHRLGATPVHAVDRTVRPGELLERLGKGKVPGHALCDLRTTPTDPLRETHLLAIRNHLRKHGGFLVITTGLRPWVEDDVRTWPWNPPTAAAILRSHLDRAVGPGPAHRLMALEAVSEFLPRGPQPREVVAYCMELRRYALGEMDEDALRRASLASVVQQVREWFETDEADLHLREKAFLIALAAFDVGPYALIAELSDLLFAFLQRTANSEAPKTVPVFGTHIGDRIERARARTDPGVEPTEWGPVRQLKAAFQDDRTARVLLGEVWTGHPSARPALVTWLGRLAEDGRPFVRTRAAATVASLAGTDLPSAMALVIEPWARSRKTALRVGAVAALALSHRAGAPNILRITDDWTAGSDPRLGWVGVRVQGLLGHERPEAALAALRVQARKQYGTETDGTLAAELAQSVELLLLSPAATRVLDEVLRTLDDHRSVFELSVRGFLGACRHTDEDTGSRPLVLDRYASDDNGSVSTGIPRLLRSALGDRDFTHEALLVLTGWIRAADAHPATEWALAALLPRLITDGTEHRRIEHLLHTIRGDDGGPRPAVTERLLTVLSRL